MPSLGDSAFIILLGLLLFGPKGLAQIARQLGKLMGEFRRASNEFRMQMEEELRVSEQADRQKQIAAIEAAAPTPPVLTSTVEEEAIDHPHLRAAPADTPIDPAPTSIAEPIGEVGPEPIVPVPIATSGGLSIMPPATGLPAPRTSSLAPLFGAVPHVEAPNGNHAAAQNGHAATASAEAEQKPMRYTSNEEARTTSTTAEEDVAAAESVHG